MRRFTRVSCEREAWRRSRPAPAHSPPRRVAFNRRTSLLNQATRAANSMALIGGGPDRLAGEARELRREIEQIKESFAVPIAAILAARSHDSEG